MEDDRSLRWVPVNTGCVGPTQSVQTDRVNLQRLCLSTFGDKSALLIIDCEDDAVAHKQMSPTRLSTSSIESRKWGR